MRFLHLMYFVCDYLWQHKKKKNHQPKKLTFREIVNIKSNLNKFKFNVNLTDIDPPNGYTISGEGQGGAAGFAKGSAAVNLAGENGATILSYNVKANVGGKLAQLGGRLIDGTARKMADEFFGNFIEIVAGETQDPDETVTTDSQASQETSGLPIWAWIIGIVAAGAAVLLAFA